MNVARDIAFLQRQLAVLDEALKSHRDEITPRDFQVTRQTSLTVHRLPEEPHDFATV